MKALTPIAVAFLALAPACPSIAGPNVNAKVLLYRGHRACELEQAPRSCSEIVTTGDLYPPNGYPIYVLVTDGDNSAGISSVHFGVSYDNAPGSGVDVLGWDNCFQTDAQFPGPNGPWPSSMSGNTITFLPCQHGEPGSDISARMIGSFYVAAYTPDNLAIVPHPADDVVSVADCADVVDVIEGDGVDHNPSHLGFARFSAGAAEPGYNPCGLSTPTISTTWARIKLLNR